MKIVDFIVREFVEMIAPVIWLTSWERIKTSLVHVAIFVGLFFVLSKSFFWGLTGVYATGEALGVGLFAVAAFVVLMVLWIAMSLAAGSGYDEYKQ